ncbi:MAG TPA: SHOCT domain-containing protein [Acidimicrobiia bacterium]|nr:SHOCT domain-containing protein [Acidimicrobiia bacterium]
MMWGDGGGWGWGWMLIGMTMMIGFWAIVAWAIVAVVRRPDVGRSPSRDAQQILDERFARGELDADEYRQRSDVLRAR